VLANYLVNRGRVILYQDSGHKQLSPHHYDIQGFQTSIYHIAVLLGGVA